MKQISSKVICAVAAVMAGPVVMFAQADANSLLTTAKTTVSGLVNTIVLIVEIVMGLVGVIKLATNLAQYMKNDPSAHDALSKVGLGLLIAVVILQVIRMTLLSQ